MSNKTKETRKCADCDIMIPFIKYKTRCIDCYKKNKIQENTKEMLKNDFNLFIYDSDADEDKLTISKIINKRLEDELKKKANKDAKQSTEKKISYSGKLKYQCLPNRSWLLKD